MNKETLYLTAVITMCTALLEVNNFSRILLLLTSFLAFYGYIKGGVDKTPNFKHKDKVIKKGRF